MYGAPRTFHFHHMDWVACQRLTLIGCSNPIQPEHSIQQQQMLNTL